MTRSSIAIALLAALALSLLPARAGAQLLDRASRAAHGRRPSSSQRARASSRADRGDWRVERALWRARRRYDRLSAPRLRVLGPSYADYPYSPDADAYRAADGALRVAGAVWLDGAWAIPSAGYAELGARVQLPIHLDLAADYAAYVEPLDDRVDSIALGRFGVAARLELAPGAHVSLGESLRLWTDWTGTLAGGETHALLELFPTAPLVVTVRGGATFFEAALALEAYASLGVLVDRVELRIAYRHLALVPYAAELPGAVLTGPALGVRVWL